MIYRAIDRCTDPGCRCDDTRGVVLYSGPDLDRAIDALRQARYVGAAVLDDAGEVVGLVAGDGCYYPRRMPDGSDPFNP